MAVTVVHAMPLGTSADAISGSDSSAWNATGSANAISGSDIGACREPGYLMP